MCGPEHVGGSGFFFFFFFFFLCFFFYYYNGNEEIENIFYNECRELEEEVEAGLNSTACIIHNLE